jgi:hypothetical protein
MNSYWMVPDKLVILMEIVNQFCKHWRTLFILMNMNNFFLEIRRVIQAQVKRKTGIVKQIFVTVKLLINMSKYDIYSVIEVS